VCALPRPPAPRLYSSGYACSAAVLPNAPSCFSSQALGGSFVLLVEEEGSQKQGGAEEGVEEDAAGRGRRWRETGEWEAPVSGEVAVRTPYLGSSTSLLNGDNHRVYYQGMPRACAGAGSSDCPALGAPLRRHGDRCDASTLKLTTRNPRP